MLVSYCIFIQPHTIMCISKTTWFDKCTENISMVQVFLAHTVYNVWPGVAVTCELRSAGRNSTQGSELSRIGP